MLPAFRQDPASPAFAGRAQSAASDDGGDERSFLRVVSHELRTPLNSILGFSEILATELYGPLGSPQYVEYAEIIRSSGEKLLKLVNQVVEIARLQAGEIKIEVRPEPLAPLLDDVVADFAQELAARDLSLAIGACEVQVASDARLLRGVLTNLLQNAVSFSPNGGQITISAKSTGGTLELVIDNEGDGVDPDDLERLFQPFEQGGNALARHGHGAGLGLAICELSCRAIGAELQLRSARGRGFSAHLLLPKV